MTRTVKSNAFALLASTSLLFASIGCNPGAITSPEMSSSSAVVESPDFVRILSASSKGSDSAPQTVAFVSQMVSAANGGVVTNGRITLEFPAGALSQDTEITISMRDDGVLGAEFGPHGTQFNKPVVMTTDLRGTSAEGMGNAVRTLYDNEKRGVYEVMEKLPATFDKNRSALRHFSRYSEDING